MKVPDEILNYARSIAQYGSMGFENKEASLKQLRDEAIHAVQRYKRAKLAKIEHDKVVKEIADWVKQNETND